MVTFAEPVVTEERTYISTTWIPPQNIMKTRGALSFSASLLKAKLCKHCICSNLCNTVQCFICGKWEKKRSRSDMCHSCASGVPDEQIKCTLCDELVHISCYNATDDVICTKCDLPEKNDVHDTLAQQGFLVMRNAFKLEEDTIEQIEDSEFHPIFNGVDEVGLQLTYDGKRVMATGPWRGAFKRKLKDFLSVHSFLKCHNGEKTISEVYALRSLSGCPIQPKHADSATEEGLRLLEPSDVPLAVLYAIEPNTKLKIWPFDQDYPVVVNLQSHDILIFRGDTAHAGYKYMAENTRLHAYIDSTAPGCKRIKGKTYILVNQMYVPCKVN